MYRKGRRILAGILAFVLVFSSGGLPVLAENERDLGYTVGLCEHHTQHTDECGYAEASEESPCTHEHTDECYIADENGEKILNCQHVHDDSCGFKESSEESPCMYECEICGAQDEPADTADSGEETSDAADTSEKPADVADVSEEPAETVDNNVDENAAGTVETDAKSVELISWEWVDEEGYLTESDGAWGIGVPGVSEENPLTKEELEPMLPKQITGENADGENVTADVSWDLSAIPEEGVWEGELELTAELSGAYKLGEDASPLVIKIELGGAATYASQANLEANTVEGISPQGTTINVFDYWLSSQDDKDISNPADYQNIGINKDKILKFGTGMGQSSETDPGTLNKNTVNYWTLSSAVRPGIVSPTLTDGYPTLSSSLGGESLAYLFDPSVEHAGKASYSDATGMLQVNEDGYFWYDSTKNFAELNRESKEFTLYNTWGVYAGGGSPNGQFFPFNTGEQVFQDGEGNTITPSDLNSKGEYESQSGTAYPDVSINHYFGLTMTTRFVQQYGGYTDAGKTDKVTYKFSGDDDVWVFIDDVLVADLGGIHDKASLVIDFSTGDISVNGNLTGTLKSMYEAAGMSGSTAWSKDELDTFADNTYHTLSFFYLERGNTDSNMSLQFNLVTIPESGIIKVDQAGNHIPGAGFTLYEADNNYKKGESICSGVTDSNGELTFLDNEGMPVSLADLYSSGIRYMILEETAPPSGYRKAGNRHLYFYTPNGGQDVVLLSDNKWETGSYASSKVTVQTGSEITLSGKSTTIDLDGNEGTLFAVVLQRQDTSEDLQASGNWKAVSGDPESGWHVAADSGLEDIIEAAQDSPYEFKVTPSGAYEVNVENLPGDISKYYYMLGENEKENAEYTIAYYYTSASSVAGATTENTWLVNSDHFERVFSVNLYVPNIQNNLYVQKLDETGEPVSAATGQAVFALYQKDDVTVADDGTYEIKTGADPVQQQTTDDMTTPFVLTGGAMFSKIPIGEYYLIETDAPEGYEASQQAVHVIVDNTGVYADAGTEEDAVSVRRGVGSVVRSMLQFATDDDVDTTLHDIKAELVNGTRDGVGFSWSDWDNDDSNDLHLQFQNTNKVLEYGTHDGKGNPYFEVESGWSRLLVRQCLAHQDDIGISSKKEDLKNQDLTNLFSGTVTVCIENQRVNSLTISKTVVDESGTGPDDAEFTFTLTMTNAGDEEMNAQYSAEGTGAPASGTIEFVGGKAELKLRDGQSVTIRNLPTGACVKVTESDIAGQTYTTTYAIDGGTPVSGKETGEIEIINSGIRNVAFTNTYVPTDEFSFTKTDQNGLEGQLLSGAVFAMYRLTCTDSEHRHEDSLIEISDAAAGTIDSSYEYAECWELAGDVVTSGADGVVSFKELPIDAAEYRLVELKAPDGYTLPEGQWRIAYDEAQKAFAPVSGDSAVGRPPAIGTNNGKYYIQNYKPGELPFSGNTGIRMFLIIGGALMIFGAAGGSGWYLCHRKSAGAGRAARSHRKNRRQ